jgi:hypothetical protein
VVDPGSQYRYYLSLDKTVKLGSSLYLLLLLGGTAAIFVGIQRLAGDIGANRLETPLLFGAALAALFIGSLLLVGKISWIADAHAFLDGHFFRLLEKSNIILFHGLVVTLDWQERDHVSEMEPEQKGALAGAVFNGLSKNNSLFTHLLRTGIFRLWIWYWIALYGTFVFTILTVESFSLVLRGVDQYAKTVFTVSWALALGHLLFGILLASRLLGMMSDVAGLLVRAHRTEIASLLRRNMGARAEPAAQAQPRN